jgi:hypothetical protein
MADEQQVCVTQPCNIAALPSVNLQEGNFSPGSYDFGDHMPTLDVSITFFSSDSPQGCVTSAKSVSLAHAAAAQPTCSELAPHGLVSIATGLHSFSIMSTCVFMLRMGASEAQASKWLSLAYPLFRCSADRNFYFAHFASTIGNEATRLDTAASDALQSVLFVCVCRLGPWHATEVGRALNRGSGPNQAQARKRPDRSTTTQTCFQALDEVAFGRKDANELPGTGIEATPATTIFSVTAHFGSSAAAVFSSSERDNPREMHNTAVTQYWGLHPGPEKIGNYSLGRGET